MKDTIITARRKRIELLTWLACFGIAFALNVYAVIYYHGKATELLTSLFYVVSFATLLYLAWTAVRLAWWGLRRLFGKKK